MSRRTEALAARLEQGARALAAFASTLTDAEWHTRVPKDGRKVGVVVHHVATMYPLEIQLAQVLATGKPVTGVTWDAVAELNAKHATEFAGVSKADTVALHKKNAAAAAAVVRGLNDDQLAKSGKVLAEAPPMSAEQIVTGILINHIDDHYGSIRKTVGA